VVRGCFRLPSFPSPPMTVLLRNLVAIFSGFTDPFSYVVFAEGASFSGDAGGSLLGWGSSLVIAFDFSPVDPVTLWPPIPPLFYRQLQVAIPHRN